MATTINTNTNTNTTPTDTGLTRSVQELIDGIEYLAESRIVWRADRESDHDGWISLAEVDRYLAPPSSSYYSEEAKQHVKEALTNGTPLVDEWTRWHYQERIDRARAMREAETQRANPPTEEVRREESCPDMRGATYGSCVKKNGRVVHSVVAREHTRARRETVVIVYGGNPCAHTTPTWADAIMYSSRRHIQSSTHRTSPTCADPLVTSAHAHCRRE